MSRGYVYVLTNPAMPGLVKIGRTTACVNGRAAQLYQTGVPQPFEVAFSILSPDCEEMELRAHERFANERLNASREFFKVDVRRVTEQLEDDLRFQVECLVDEFMPDHHIVYAEESVDFGAFKPSFCKAVRAANLYPPEIVEVLYQIEGEEAAKAIERLKSARKTRTLELVSGAGRKAARS